MSVLKDGRDPLYTMQAAVNGASVIALAWAFVALLEAWRIGDIGWFGLASSGIITLTVGLFISLELILSHDLVLLRKLARFSALKRHLFLSAVVEVLQQHLLVCSEKKGHGFQRYTTIVKRLKLFAKNDKTACKTSKIHFPHGIEQV